MNRQKESIHILGPGAMGLLWASQFIEQGWKVTLLHRKLAKKDFLTPITKQTNGHITHYQALNKTASGLNSKIKILLITVKAHQLAQAFNSILPKIDSKTIIILMQNGAGSDHKLLQSYPCLKNNTVVQAVTTHGALRISPFEFEQTGIGYCWLGLNPIFLSNIEERQLPEKLESLLKLELITGWKTNIEQFVWEKLIVNASINPLSSILNCRNGKLLNRENTALMAEIVTESCKVANRAGITIEPLSMLGKVQLVCRQTSENKSSMLQDILSGKQTEIDYINQFIINTAEQYSISTPWNNCLTYIIKSLFCVRIKSS